MNKTQKIILFFAATIIFLMMLFPPFSEEEMWRGQGYRFILDMPGGARVNVGLLIAQWICVMLISGITYFIGKYDDFLNENNVAIQWCRKHPATVAIITAIVLLVFGIMGFLTSRSFVSFAVWLFFALVASSAVWWELEHEQDVA